MKWRTIFALAGGLTVFAAFVGIVVAQLTDTQTATGTITATSTSADLYICEPGVPGPACGTDDSGADEIVFETIEDISPGEVIQWDLRLVNTGPVDFLISQTTLLTVTELTDPGSDCPDGVLVKGPLPSGSGSDFGIFVLGKAGDDLNDNPQGVLGASPHLNESGTYVGNIKIAAGDYEDVRLRLQLSVANTDNCDGNEWTVTYDIVVG